MEKQKLLDRIKKLLALSKDPSNECEAAAAGQKAQQLLEQYNLTIGEVELEASPSAEVHVICSQNPDHWFKVLINVCDFLFVTKSILCPRWGATSFVAICGLPQNVEVAAETLRYFCDAFRHLVRGRGTQLRKRRKNSSRANSRRLKAYRLGAARRVHAEAQDLKRVEQQEKLVLIGNAIALRHLERCYPKYKVGKSRAPKSSLEELLGWQDGANVNPYGTRKQLGAAG